MNSHLIRRSVAVVAAAALLLSACGDDGSTASSSPDPGTGAALECAGPRSAPAGTTDETFDHDGATRTYRLTVADDLDAQVPVPVIVNMHGFISTAEQQDLLTGLDDAGAAAGYVVISPQGLDTDIPVNGGVVAPFWNVAPAVDTSDVEDDDLVAADDIGFIFALLDHLEAELCLDADREYLTGLSNGAAMAMTLICEDDDRFAAAAPVAGANFASNCRAERLTPVLAVHGDADVLAPYEGGDVFGYPLDLPAAEDQLAEFATLGPCEPEPEVEPIGDDVVHRTWSRCGDGDRVELYTVLGGGHTWPGSELFERGAPTVPEGDESGSGAVDEAESAVGFGLDEIFGQPTESIDATELILDFFAGHER